MRKQKIIIPAEELRRLNFEEPLVRLLDLCNQRCLEEAKNIGTFTVISTQEDLKDVFGMQYDDFYNQASEYVEKLYRQAGYQVLMNYQSGWTVYWNKPYPGKSMPLLRSAEELYRICHNECSLLELLEYQMLDRLLLARKDSTFSIQLLNFTVFDIYYRTKFTEKEFDAAWKELLDELREAGYSVSGENMPSISWWHPKKVDNHPKKP